MLNAVYKLQIFRCMVLGQCNWFYLRICKIIWWVKSVECSGWALVGAYLSLNNFASVSASVFPGKVKGDDLETALAIVVISDTNTL